MSMQQEQIINRKIWKWLWGRYGDDCVLIELLVSRSFLWDMKVIFHLYFLPLGVFPKSFFFFSMQILPYQAANQTKLPVVSNVINTEQRAEFNLAAAGWKMEQSVMSDRVHITTQTFCPSISTCIPTYLFPFCLVFTHAKARLHHTKCIALTY